MSIELPLYAQQKRNTCALACLRMVLAAFGTRVDEQTLEEDAQMAEGGTPIEELERLASQHNLLSEIQQTTTSDLRRILAVGHFPIAFIDRAVFDLGPGQRETHSLINAKIHAVVPVHLTRNFVTFNDPLLPRITRKSLGLFQQAHRMLGNYCVVCSRPE